MTNSLAPGGTNGARLATATGEGNERTMAYLDPHDPRPAVAYTLADAKACRNVASDLKRQRCWHSPGTPARRALERNIEINEFLADRIEREHGLSPSDIATASDPRA